MDYLLTDAQWGVLRRCCRVAKARKAAGGRTTAASWRRCCGWRATGAGGGPCQRNGATGTRRTRASSARWPRACGPGCWRPCNRTTRCTRCWWTRPLCGRTSTRAGRAKNGPQALLGRNRGRLTSKLHVVANARGRFLRGSLTAGQRHDAPQALPLLDGLAPAYLIANRGYDSDPLVAARGTQAVILPRRKRRTPRA
ncbi:MAG: transposase [Hymenobacter sp.]|nr:transposase [Hymenobacter sp.]